MAIAIYLEGTEGQTDGTIEVPGDGVGIELDEVGSVAVFHFRAPSGKQTSEAVTVNAPLDCEVSLDGNAFASTATYQAGDIQDSNVACYVKRTALTQTEARVEERLSTTPHCDSVAVVDIVIPDTTPPTLTGSLTATPSNEQVALDWSDATDNTAVTGYDIEYGTTDSYGTATTSATNSKTITELTNGTTYYFRVRAYDAAGNKSSWLTATATPVAPSGDTTAPTLTGSVNLATYTTSSLVLQWSAATDNVGVTGYDIEYGTTTGYGSSTTSATTNKTLTGLEPGTTYYYRVRAYDAAGNKSSWITGNGKTSAVLDTIAPTLTGSITATPSVDSIALSWNAGTDNVGVTGYDIEHGTTTSYGTATTSTTNSKTITDLTNGTLYYFRVRAYDAAGNKSSWITASATTEEVGAFNDTFSDASLDTSFWSAQTAGDGTITTGAGAAITAPAIADGAILYRKTPLTLNANKTYKWKWKLNSSVANSNYYFFSIEDTASPFVPNTSSDPTQNHARASSVATGVYARARLLSYAASNSAMYMARSSNTAVTPEVWFDPSTGTWVASGHTYPPIAPDTYYVSEFSTNASSQWRFRLLSADGSTALVDTGWQTWTDILGFNHSPYLIIGGEPFTNASLASTVIDWYDEV